MDLNRKITKKFTKTRSLIEKLLIDNTYVHKKTWLKKCFNSIPWWAMLIWNSCTIS